MDILKSHRKERAARKENETPVPCGLAFLQSRPAKPVPQNKTDCKNGAQRKRRRRLARFGGVVAAQGRRAVSFAKNRAGRRSLLSKVRRPQACKLGRSSLFSRVAKTPPGGNRYSRAGSSPRVDIDDRRLTEHTISSFSILSRSAAAGVAGFEAKPAASAAASVFRQSGSDSIITRNGGLSNGEKKRRSHGLHLDICGGSVVQSGRGETPNGAETDAHRRENREGKPP